MTDPVVTTSTLANGFPITTVELPHLHTVDVAVFVRVGSRFETVAQNGLSHFVEHMLFRGAGEFDTVQHIHDYSAACGSSVNAETARDCTVFRMRVVPDLVPGAVRLLSEMMTKPRFQEIDTERKLVLEEINGDAEDGAGDLAMRALLKGHPLGQPIIGTVKNVRDFTLADVRNHHRRFYTARNTTLCVAGPVTHVEVVRLAAEQMMRWNRAGRIEEFEPAPVRRANAKATVVHRRDRDDHIEMSFAIRGVGVADRRFVAQSALVRAWDTRLHARIADQHGLAYSIGAFADPFIDTSVISVDVEVNADKLDYLIEMLLTELLYPKLDGITSRIKASARTEAMALLDDPEAMTEWFGGLSLYAQPPTVSHRLHAIETLSENQIHGVASDIVRPERLALAWVGDLSKKAQATLRRRLPIK